MNHEVIPPHQSILEVCEAKFDEAYQLWSKGGDELFTGHGAFVPDVVENLCLDSDNRIFEFDYGAWMILLRPGISHPGVELQDPSTDEAKEVEFTLIMFIKSNGETREFFEVEAEEQMKAVKGIMITEDGTLITDFGVLPDSFASELAQSIASAKITKKPDWLE